MSTTRSADQKRKAPVRSEIAKTGWERAKIKYEVEIKGMFGKSTFQEREKPGLQFYALAIGPQGRYVVRTSRSFEGTIESDRAGSWISLSKDAQDALNGLLQDLWNDGWQPTSFGRYWHDFNLRRIIEE